MTSIHDEINALFSWNPPPLRPATLRGKKSSSHTRQPAFYDKHFSERLLLRYVKRLPSLVQDLAENVDHALLAASATLPPVDDFFTAKDRERALRRVEKTITDEKGVASFYDKITAPFCMSLASTLALHPKAPMSNWTPLLVWTQSVSSSGYAIMDGELRVMRAEGDDRDAHEMIVETMESETRRIYEAIRDSGAPFATWEMKSPFAGPLDVMLSVPKLGNFVWTTCKLPNCSKDKKHMKELQKIEQTTVGDDTLDPPWHVNNALPDTPVEPSSESFSEGPPPVKRRIIRSTAAPASSSSMAPPQQLASMPMLTAKPLSEASSGTSLRRSSRTRPTAAPASASMPPPSTPASAAKSRGKGNGKGKGKEKEKAQEEEEKTVRIGKRKRKPGDDDEDYRDRHDLTAQSLVQQAWAQAVRADGTIIVLHSGNHELVCLRHRATQTLYVSDLIEPSVCGDPGYGKLQVGIYVAAVQDAIDRTRQRLHRAQLKLSDDEDGNDPAGGSNDRDDRDDDRGSGSGHKGDQGHGEGGRWGSGRGNPGGSGRNKRGQFQGKAGRKDPSVDELDTEVFCLDCVPYQKTMQVASKRDMLLLSLQYGVYDSPVPASFVRSAPPIMAKAKILAPWSPQPISTYTPNDCLTIVLTSEIGRGATGVAHRGTLRLMDVDGSVPLDVVVKFAFDSQQRDMLRTEYASYRHLRSKCVLRGITTTLGFFDDTEGGPCALVMLYAGDPLADVPERVLSVSDCKSALSTLASIHRAGILHGDIRRNNVLVSDAGVTLIDFGHSERCDDQDAMDGEYARLRFCLGFG